MTRERYENINNIFWNMIKENDLYSFSAIKDRFIDECLNDGYEPEEIDAFINESHNNKIEII